MNLILILFIGILLSYEIQKLLQIKYFLKIRTLTSDYYSTLIYKKKNAAYKEVIKITLVEFFYSIVTFIGLFTNNSYFFIVLVLLSLVETFFFKYIKNKIARKIFCILDTLLSIILLSLSVYNLLYYNLPSLQFINLLFNIKI